MEAATVEYSLSWCPQIRERGCVDEPMTLIDEDYTRGWSGHLHKLCGAHDFSCTARRVRELEALFRLMLSVWRVKVGGYRRLVHSSHRAGQGRAAPG